MHDCEICGTRHAEDPEVCRAKMKRVWEQVLSEAFEGILKEVGDSPRVRLMIANYTIGYMGASYGLHIPE